MFSTTAPCLPLTTTSGVSWLQGTSWTDWFITYELEGLLQDKPGQSESSSRIWVIWNSVRWTIICKAENESWGLSEGRKSWDNLTRPDKSQSWESRSLKSVTIADYFITSVSTYTISIQGLYAYVFPDIWKNLIVLFHAQSSTLHYYPSLRRKFHLNPEHSLCPGHD